MTSAWRRRKGHVLRRLGRPLSKLVSRTFTNRHEVVQTISAIGQGLPLAFDLLTFTYLLAFEGSLIFFRWSEPPWTRGIAFCGVFCRDPAPGRWGNVPGLLVAVFGGLQRVLGRSPGMPTTVEEPELGYPIGTPCDGS